MADTMESFEQKEFEFEGMRAIIVFPSTEPNGKWLLKTEYFGAFPKFQIQMLERGYHLAYLQNVTRWCKDEDIERKHRFIKYISETYSLSSSCVPVGMSCGGMIAIKLAAAYPEDVSAMFIDAPVINLLSCPAGLGAGRGTAFSEFENAMGMTLKDLISYRNHPLDKLDILIENKTPVCIVCGDADDVVPFDENGIFVIEKYKNSGVPFKSIVVKGRGHHPHGLDDNTPIIDFISQF